MKKRCITVLLLALGAATAAIPGVASGVPGLPQVADTSFNARVASPAYDKQHPKVLFDEGHNNLYTSIGRYKPFAELIMSDGYKLNPGAGSLSKDQLSGYDVLVIVDAAGPKDRRDAPAFTDAECDAVRDWVKAGGALLLITDHAPFGSAASSLARRFDVDVTPGFTIDIRQYNQESGDQTELVFTREASLLGDHPITRGRSDKERIDKILTFSGTSVKGPKDSVALLKLSDTAKDVLPPDRKPSSPEDPPVDHKVVSASGRAQGIALEFGKGRVVVLGEAPMLTAQVMPNGLHFGMNISGTDNKQLALNIMHWLSKLI